MSGLVAIATLLAGLLALTVMVGVISRHLHVRRRRTSLLEHALRRLHGGGRRWRRMAMGDSPGAWRMLDRMRWRRIWGGAL